MAQAERVVAALKRHMKSRGVTYAMLAERIGMSLPTVKRMLASGRLTLERLDAVCEAVGVDFADLAGEARERDRLPVQLSLEQEKVLADEPPLLTLFYLLLNEWTVERIVAGHDLSEAQCLTLLLRLEKLGLIELHPRNRVRLRVSRSLRWRTSGPVVKRWRRQMVEEFVFDDFDREGEVLRFGQRQVSAATQALVVRKLERIAAEFEELADLDALLPPEERRPVGFLVALRPFRLSVFDALPRKAET